VCGGLPGSLLGSRPVLVGCHFGWWLGVRSSTALFLPALPIDCPEFAHLPRRASAPASATVAFLQVNGLSVASPSS
jgi:hypothetical protein